MVICIKCGKKIQKKRFVKGWGTIGYVKDDVNDGMFKGGINVRTLVESNFTLAICPDCIQKYKYTIASHERSIGKFLIEIPFNTSNNEAEQKKTRFDYVSDIIRANEDAGIALDQPEPEPKKKRGRPKKKVE